MELDDQLAALAAGELDDDAARALEARAAGDAVLAARLARFRRLEALLADDDATMSPEAAARLDARLADALAALPDGPVVEDDAAAAAAATSAPSPAGATEAGAAQVIDLGARRTARGLPRWASAAMAAAAVVAGVAVVGLPSLSGDDAGFDAATEEQAERVQEATDDAAAESSDEMSDESARDEMAAEAFTADEPQDSEVEDDAAADPAGNEVTSVPPQLGGRSVDTRPLPPGVADELLADPRVRDRVAEVDGGLDQADERAEQLAVLDDQASDPDPLVASRADCARELLADSDGAVLVVVAAGEREGAEALGLVLVGQDGSSSAVVLDAGCTVLERAAT